MAKGVRSDGSSATLTEELGRRKRANSHPTNKEGKDRRYFKNSRGGLRKDDGSIDSKALKLAVWEQFQKDRPKGEELLPWAEQLAAKWSVELEDIAVHMHSLIHFSERMVLMKASVEADQIAGAVGLTLTRALKALSDALEATKMIAMGDLPPLEVPDHGSRLRGAELALRFMGKMAPQEYKVVHDHRHLVMNMSDQELQDEMRRLYTETGKVLEALPLPAAEEPQPAA